MITTITIRRHAKKEEHDDHDDHDGHEGHAHGEYDPHIWLDPMNAKVILNEMVEHLIENDLKNAAKYKSNLKKALKEIDKLNKDVKAELSKVLHQSYFMMLTNILKKDLM